MINLQMLYLRPSAKKAERYSDPAKPSLMCEEVAIPTSQEQPDQYHWKVKH